MKHQRNQWSTSLLLLAVIGLTVFPLVMIKDSEFGGADGKAEEMITELHPQYKPWFQPILEPPGGETEGLLFALQAALGAGVVGYTIGWYRGRSQAKITSNNDSTD